eukprot:CAMPEP_0118640816 /NCGR_PEP_ID=MMETSP0785-20121206/4951_1 /TAXON_ID=91992 /ORGANISM="Bolidomonas pacifica, Strain CCMP 1866" /LENGTH=45 /DNA_ID= /DNA_START= /DNA_END= /DNA_ORIENTATION=
MPHMCKGVAPPVVTSFTKSGKESRRAETDEGVDKALLMRLYPPPA